MKSEKCSNSNCEYNVEMMNPQFILEILSMTGYDKYKFCSMKCFLEFVVEINKRKLKKMLK